MSNSRYIPLEIRKYLRKEVEFGCPVENCRIPFLEYHHFDPPYHQGQQHIKEGMIAFCPTHHSKAEVSWSNDELRKMKMAKRRTPVAGNLDWKLEDCIFIAGRNYFIGEAVSLRVHGKELFAINRNTDGQLKFNMMLWDKNGEVVTQIQDNDMMVNTLNIEDLECSASGNMIKVEAIRDKNFFQVHFRREKLHDFQRKMHKKLSEEAKSIIYNFAKDKQKDDKITIIEFSAKVTTNKIDLSIQKSSIILDGRPMGYDVARISDRVFTKDAGLSVSINNKEFLYFGQ